MNNSISLRLTHARFRRIIRGTLPGIILLGIILLFPVSCSRGNDSADGAARRFLQALQGYNFAEAAEVSLDNTAGLLLFMEKMHETAAEQGETISLPIPPANREIMLVSEEARTGYRRMRYRIGETLMVLNAFESDGRWFIELPRESWVIGEEEP
ncbi:hypothetical protein [Salinispira pacifica]|uniref:Uncharacterized protein n=1 Tax=Salinispira pacifica TaxID=1307761 RepID=V5WN22_9SPIO|nr:hypothetical protein [Salinispira pacifica]AHC16564.1 hypothetical protein L21SP2_3224 [Salinispira pacifica]